MSGTLDKLFAKGKAKVKEFTSQPGGHQQQQQQQQGYPGQGYPGQQAPQGYNQGQYSGGQYPPPQAPPNPGQYTGGQYPPQQYPPPHQGQYSGSQYPPPQPPPGQASYTGGQYPPQQQNQQWGAPTQPPQQQWGPPPPQQQFGAPPIPAASKPHSVPPQSPQPHGPPPVPQNRPASAQPPPPQNLPPPQGEKVYWKPSFDIKTPVNHNFRHEIGDHGWGNNEKQMYTDSPANSFHHDNRLIVRGLVQNGSYTSARLTSHQTLSRPRGYLTATILPPVAEGIWPAYWMLPKDPFQWPNDGEVDIFESWNGDCVNHTCLHWGHFNGEDHDKHRVVETHLPAMPRQPHTFGFAWIEEEGIPGWRGRMIWYIDGRPVMKGNIPPGTRRMEEFRLMINIAMGGNVCQGKLPKDGYYDLVVSDVKMCEEPQGGWQGFEQAWNTCIEGKTM
ncbi:glycoside hydrolase family 16 protein [Plenodomus tracheiphilus IPT5]|uniref:Glycoside hydrolase family 16 protein n=1 Tax=Plenodomus tracheiphilus IPT5 TaxID=1408161 RepID=A0A6A7AT53_9PLEO|nr:glycoside hydrolase family 16 protein [Plenodomus tracheiphilus IPT5]